MKEYENIVGDIKQKILSGDYSPGERLPSIKALTQIYHVSTITVRNALQELSRGGYIETRERSGCFVRSTEDRNSLHIEFNRVFNMTDELLEEEVLRQEMLHGLYIENPDGTPIHQAGDFMRISWLYRSYFRAPIAYDTAFLLARNYEEQEQLMRISDMDDIWALLNEAERITLTVRLTLPDAETAELLALKPQEHVFSLEQCYYQENDSLFGVSRTYVLPGSIELHAVTAK